MQMMLWLLAVLLVLGGPALASSQHPGGDKQPSELGNVEEAPDNAPLVAAVDANGRDYPPWCPLSVGVAGFPQKSELTKKKYLLGAQLYCRIYEGDKAQLSRVDLLHWISYLKYVGVERVYLYDFWIKPEEQVLDTVAPLVDAGFLVYYNGVPNEPLVPLNSHKRQVLSKNHCAERHGDEVEWLLTCDMDEYPVVRGDYAPLSLVRVLAGLPSDVSLVTMCNRRILGQRDFDHGPLLVQQMHYTWQTCAWDLVKPIVRTSAHRAAVLHSWRVKEGRTVKSGAQLPIEMWHHIGGRMNNWRPYTEPPNKAPTQSFLLGNQLAPDLLRCPYSADIYPRVWFASTMPDHLRQQLASVCPSWQPDLHPDLFTRPANAATAAVRTDNCSPTAADFGVTLRDVPLQQQRHPDAPEKTAVAQKAKVKPVKKERSVKQEGSAKQERVVKQEMPVKQEGSVKQERSVKHERFVKQEGSVKQERFVKQEMSNNNVVSERLALKPANNEISLPERLAFVHKDVSLWRWQRRSVVPRKTHK